MRTEQLPGSLLEGQTYRDVITQLKAEPLAIYGQECSRETIPSATTKMIDDL